MTSSPNKATTFKWRHPNEVMQLQKLKKKKKALQARFSSLIPHSTKDTTVDSVVKATKRKNPFLSANESKRSKCDLLFPDPEESSDQTLFKLLQFTSGNTGRQQKDKENLTSFTNILSNLQQEEKNEAIVKVAGESWIPVDWSLKTKVRFMSQKPFLWNQKLKIGEEASGVTSFTRCLDMGHSATSLDTSSKAKFHQCCLYWQQPYFPWHSLFPRKAGKATNSITSVATTAVIKHSLQAAWSDSLRSLFQLIRTRQCPYFYACANTFTVLFRAAGIAGFSDVHALITPSTRGFRHMLRQEDIEFSMPLKGGRNSDQGYDTLDSTCPTSDDNHVEDEDESPDEQWLQSMGINADDIKQINYTQERIQQKAECEVDNSEQSLILIEGVEVQALYNFLINCKSAVALTGPYAGIPPTLLSPVAFHGATLNGLKVRESKVHVDNEDYFSLELLGPILPQTIHNLFDILPDEHSVSATFANLAGTLPLSKVNAPVQGCASKGPITVETSGIAIFRQENLSDCGLNSKVLKHFCSDDKKHVTTLECLKYTAESKTYSWS